MKNAQMLVDFASFSVLPQKTSENPLSSHPLDFGGHASLRSTLSFTGASVTTLSLCGEEIASASTRVDDGGFDDDTTVFDQFLDVGAGVGIANFRLLSGIEPDFALADASDGGCESLLGAQVDHGCVENERLGEG